MFSRFASRRATSVSKQTLHLHHSTVPSSYKVQPQIIKTTNQFKRHNPHPFTTTKSAFTTTTSSAQLHTRPYQSQLRKLSSVNQTQLVNQSTQTQNAPTTITQLLSQHPLPSSVPLDQSSLLITGLIGAAFGIGTALVTGAAWKQPTAPITTFADIDRILVETDPNPYSFGTDAIDTALIERKQREHEYNSQDYALVMSLEEERMPLREKIDALRQILLRQIEQTYPIYNLIESKLAYLNSNVIDAVYLQRAMEAKLFHRALDIPLDQLDVKHRVERDSTQRIMNPEQLQHMRQNLIMTHDKAVHDFPTREQSENLDDNECRQIYQELAEFSMLSCVKLNYYKFVALLYNLETVIDADQRALFDRMDTTVTADRNTTANAFTESVDGLPQLSLRARTIIYRNKTMEVIANVLAQTEFVIDAIPQINDAIKTNIKTEIYRFARQSLTSPDEALDVEELDKFVEQEWERTKLDYSFVESLHREFYHTWLKLLFNNEERISLLSEQELDDAYRYLRVEYLAAKAQEHTPRAFMEAYQVLRPLQYNELYNQAYLLLPEFEIEKPLAEVLMQEYQRVDRLEDELTKAGL